MTTPCDQTATIKKLEEQSDSTTKAVVKIETSLDNMATIMNSFVTEMRPIITEIRENGARDREQMLQMAEQINRLFTGQREIKDEIKKEIVPSLTSRIKPLEDFMVMHKGQDKGKNDVRLVVASILGVLLALMNVVQFAMNFNGG